MKSSQANSESQDVTGVTDSSLVTKRGFLRLTAAGVGASAVGVGSMQSERLQPVGRSEAGLPVLMAAGFGAGLAAGYIIEEHGDLLTGTDIDKDDLDNFVGADARVAEVYKTANQMASADDSVYTNIINWLEDGWENAAWVDIKIETVEAIEDGDTEQEVQDRALAVLYDKARVPQQNALDHWNEQFYRFEDMYLSLVEHSEIDAGNYIQYEMFEGEDRRDDPNSEGSNPFDVADVMETDIELYDGSQYTVLHNDGELGSPYNDTFSGDDDDTYPGDYYTPFAITEDFGNNFSQYIHIDNNDGDRVFFGVHAYRSSIVEDVLRFSRPEMILHQTLDDKVSELETDVNLFVSELYDAYQSGDIDLDNVVGVSAFEEFAAKSDGATRAVGEMAALGVPVAIEGGGRIRLEDSNIEIDGFLGTRDDQFTATVGDTYDPETDVEGDVYFALKEGTLSGTLGEDEYEGALDGGVFELHEEPYASTTYQVQTVNDEIASADASEFIQNDAGNWEVDLSDQLDESIADVDNVQFMESDPSVSPDSIRVDEQFTVLSYEDKDGEEIDDIEFSSRNTQTTSTDIEELQKELEQVRDLVDDLEDLEDDGAVGGGGGGWFDFEAPSSNVIVAAAAALGGGYLLTNNSDDST